MSTFDDLEPDKTATAEQREVEHFDTEVLPAWVAEMDFPLAPPVLGAIQDAVSRGEIGYPLADEQTDLPARARSGSACATGGSCRLRG